MAQTLYSIYMHIVFSTKNRFDFIQPEIEDELYAYIGGIVRNYKGVLLKAGGTSNHIHLLVSLNKNYLVPDLIGDAKTRIFKLDQNKKPDALEIRLAGRLFGILARIHTDSGGQEIHRQSKRASQTKVVRR